MTVTQMVDSIINSSYYNKSNKIVTEEEADAIYVRNHNVEGLIIKDGVNFRKIIPVDKKALERILEEDKKEWIKWNGTSKSTTKIPDMIKDYVMSSVKKEDRLSASWTIEQALHEQGDKYLRIIRQHNPKWNYGEPFDPKILDEPHIDTRI